MRSPTPCEHTDANCAEDHQDEFGVEEPENEASRTDTDEEMENIEQEKTKIVSKRSKSKSSQNQLF